MEMSWSRLADRCRLFISAHKGMLVELLKEAEVELARECQILESSETWETPFPDADGYGALGTGNEYLCLLPEDYSQMNAVFYNGKRLSQIDEHEKDLNSDNLHRSGTPSKYYIRKGGSGQHIRFDYYPKTGSIRADYKATLTSRHQAKRFLNQLDSSSFFAIETGLGEALNGLDAIWQAGKTTGACIDIRFASSSPPYGAQYEATAGAVPLVGATITVKGYRTIAPIIPSQYHKDLCDYAIAIASASTAPELHDKHLLAWKNNIEKIKNEDADRELVHSVRREV